MNNNAMTTVQIARTVGADLGDVEPLLTELDRAGVFSFDKKKAIFSRRMIRDERIRDVRASSGKLGGNPALLKQIATKGLTTGVNQTLKQKPTPSFAFAVSTSVATEPVEPVRPTQQLPDIDGTIQPANGKHSKTLAAKGSRLHADWRLPDDWKQWAVEAHNLDPQHVVRISLAFRDYWHAKPGREACKLDWLATWRNWIRKECGQ